MNPDSISKRVIALVIVGLLVSGFILWLGLHRPPPPPTVAPTASATPTPVSDHVEIPIVSQPAPVVVPSPVISNYVVATPLHQLQGQVVDAVTDQPITKFRIGLGRYLVQDVFSLSSRMKEYADPNGNFTIDLDEATIGVTRVAFNGIRADSEDYAQLTQTIPESVRGVVKVIIRLRPSAALQGKVVSPDGTPLPDVTVAAAENRRGGVNFSSGSVNLILRDQRLETPTGDPQVVTTDRNGQFKLPLPFQSGVTVIAASELGFASDTLENVRARGGLVLQPFGRIEGTLFIAGNVGAGKELMFTPGNDTGLAAGRTTYRTSTDDQGHFSFEKILAGTGSVRRRINTSPTTTAYSYTTEVIVEPGKTTKLTLGDSGAVFQGTVRFETPLPGSESNVITGNLSTPRPPPMTFTSMEEVEDYRNSIANSVKQSKRFDLTMSADGSFTVDSVPPGNYVLEIRASTPRQPSSPLGKLLALGTLDVTVPENVSPQTPINLGEILLKPSTK